MRSKSDLGAYLRRQRSRLGAPKAITATAYKLARIFYTVMQYGVAYPKRSEEEFANEHQKRMEQNLHRRAKELGYEVHRPPAIDAEAMPAGVASDETELTIQKVMLL